jgi:hypothetical protein
MADSFYGQFQSEHEFQSAIFNDDQERKAVLKRLGYEENMVSNRRALFSDPDIIAQLESAPENHPFKLLLRANGWGTVYHPGGGIPKERKERGRYPFKRKERGRYPFKRCFILLAFGYATNRANCFC